MFTTANKITVVKKTFDGHYSYSLDITPRQRSVGTRFRNLV